MSFANEEVSTAYSPDRPAFEDLERIVDLARRRPFCRVLAGPRLSRWLDDPDAVDRFWTLTHDPRRTKIGRHTRSLRW